MKTLSIAEKATILHYSLLASQIALTLDAVANGARLSVNQRLILQQGADLLKRTVEGATLVEGKPFEHDLCATIQGLSVYGYALSTLRRLNVLASASSDSTGFFNRLYDEMQKVISEDAQVSGEIEELKRFFSALNASFKNDIQEDSYPKEKNVSFMTRTVLNEYFYA